MCHRPITDRVAIPFIHVSDSEGFTTIPVPGRRCRTCLERGDTIWVIPGTQCRVCDTTVN
ncbi:hypothetical protein T440DRAFT_408328 [Plenodomus tracheiphilus IPT5]|uniref:Uncharacterized protein n=1 Tax=Plenodomus tracheiphilus IPT5 TaxID=1408161 RepID=A0A6A7AT16_9PLEO|nr:hypothetical protein T440DRAFT_408931 [Plenodomus tracheiphilus IPT5]KAF2845268.1 hypothetical protein T440DRAFT_408328 [Plenodomus tracheiphilus IPT5]